jgi:hypothetical protein
MHFPTGKVIAEKRRDLGTAKSLKAAKAIAMSDWAVISTDPLPVIKPTALEWKSVTPDLEASFLFQPPDATMIVTTAPTRSGITSGQFHGSRSGRRAGVGAWSVDRAVGALGVLTPSRRPNRLRSDAEGAQQAANSTLRQHVRRGRAVHAGPFAPQAVFEPR